VFLCFHEEIMTERPRSRFYERFIGGIEENIPIAPENIGQPDQNRANYAHLFDA